mmetsp:Transcript_52140/g.92961  ORF Transcript_52140/g.92961 Transcript_52140/m.92961 type:complete len:255 (+) Transcript_52140:4334-5098(+)
MAQVPHGEHVGVLGPGLGVEGGHDRHPRGLEVLKDGPTDGTFPLGEGDVLCSEDAGYLAHGVGRGVPAAVNVPDLPRHHKGHALGARGLHAGGSLQLVDVVLDDGVEVEVEAAGGTDQEAQSQEGKLYMLGQVVDGLALGLLFNVGLACCPLLEELGGSDLAIPRGLLALVVHRRFTDGACIALVLLHHLCFCQHRIGRLGVIHHSLQELGHVPQNHRVSLLRAVGGQDLEHLQRCTSLMVDVDRHRVEGADIH